MRTSPEFEQCFRELIEQPSVSSIDPAHDQSNQGVIDTLANWLEALGFDCEIMTVSKQPLKSNLVAVRGEKDQAAGLVLSGHTDTVPYDDSGWDTDPFQLTEKNGNYYGLATADMKSFFPIIIETLERMQSKDFSRPITVIATADEESTMSGARLLQDSGNVSGDYCIIGEPTGLKPIYSHKGIIIESIHLQGRSGHSSNPALGNSALEGMNIVINELQQWREELQAENRNDDFAVPFPTLNFGRIHGGDSPNRICASCELSMDLRMLPGMNIETLTEQLHTKVKEALKGTGLNIDFDSKVQGIPPMLTSLQSEIIGKAESYTKHDAECVAFGTEGPFFNDMGIETVILGPGDIDVAHQPNEYLQIDRIEPMIDILTNMLLHFCGGRQ